MIGNFIVLYLWHHKYISSCNGQIENPLFTKFTKWFVKQCGGDPNAHSIYSLTGEKNFGYIDGKPFSTFDYAPSNADHLTLEELKEKYPEIFFDEYNDNSNVANLIEVTK